MTDTSHKIIRNTLTNTASYVVVFLSNLALLPLIVHSLGNEYYGGIWVIVGTLTAYMGLIDLGTGTAFVKFVAEYYARGDESSLNEVINTGIVVYATVGAVLVLTAFLAGSFILHAVGVPPSIMDDAQFVFRIGVVIFVYANMVSPLTAVATGIQRMDVLSYVTIATQILNIVGTVSVLRAGYGVRGLILNNLAMAILNSTCLILFAFHWIPSLRLGLRHYRFARIRQFISYGINLQVSRLAQFVLFQTDRVLTLRFFGNVSATFYDIGARLNSAARSISALSISALIPAVAELDAKQHYDHILVIYERGSKYIALAATFVFAFLITFTPGILRSWMGEHYDSSISVARILAIGYFFNISTGVASSLAAGVGKTEFERRFGIFACVFNIIATIGGILLLGPLGIAAGTSLTLTIGALYFMGLVHSYLRVPVRKILLVFVRPVVGGTLSAAVVAAVSSAVHPAPVGRIENLVVLLTQFAAYGGVFILLMFLIKVVDEDDIRIVRGFMQQTVRIHLFNRR